MTETETDSVCVCARRSNNVYDFIRSNVYVTFLTVLTPKALNLYTRVYVCVFLVVRLTGVAVYVNSLVMIADGLHNASDGLALAVAFWAEKV